MTELFVDRGAGVLASGALLLPADLSEEARRLFEALQKEEPASAEDLAQRVDLPAATVLAALFELEGAGLAALQEGGRYGLVRR